MDYKDFIKSKSQCDMNYGFEPVFMPDQLKDFQAHMTEWAIRKGRAAKFADCGLGKTFMQLVWAENVVRHTNKRVLILTPLAVSYQTVSEGEKFGIECTRSGDGVLHSKITVTNYERLKYFNATDFAGVVCDESSILKNFDGETRKAVTEFMRNTPYRLLCTATAAPNDYIELGTSSEALGHMGSQDMINYFFKKSKSTTTARQERMSGFFTLRPHAKHDFWRWICSWARAIRKPSDIGFSDDGFKLPPLNVNQHIVSANSIRDGFLFDLPAVGLKEQRADLSRTVKERCGMAADLINAHNDPAIAWCNLNREGEILNQNIEGSEEVAGRHDDDHKEDVFKDFVKGNIRVLITKPTIGGFGLNLQHCAHQTYFPSHSYEQYYQCIRRCWRFGQKNPVTVDMITTEGQDDVLRNLNRKADQSSLMFDNLVKMMNDELNINKVNKHINKEELPSWL